MLLHDILIMLGEATDMAQQMSKGDGLPPHPHPEQDKWALWQIIGMVVGAAITAAGAIVPAVLTYKSFKRKKATG